MTPSPRAKYVRRFGPHQVFLEDCRVAERNSIWPMLVKQNSGLAYARLLDFGETFRMRKQAVDILRRLGRARWLVLDFEAVSQTSEAFLHELLVVAECRDGVEPHPINMRDDVAALAMRVRREATAQRGIRLFHED